MTNLLLHPLLPGATIGVLGGGQLGRMLVFVAKRMGYTVVIYSDVPNSPAGQVSDRAIVGSYSDMKLLLEFREQCDVITYEFENIPVEACNFLQEEVPVRPHPDAIYHTQDRSRERRLLADLKVPVAPHIYLSEKESLQAVPETFPFPAILKTAAFGYDGKGQALVQKRGELENCWNSLQNTPCILEERISFEKEFSIIIARSVCGEMVSYGPIENHHEHHILAVSSCPGDVPKTSGEAAVVLAKKIAERLSVAGVITVEFFLKTDGTVLVNEIAPRPHNSGHLTIEGFFVSQFEQQLRGVCGLPLGNSDQRSPAVMVNLLGDLWDADGQLNTLPLVSEPSTFIHLYGKAEPRPGRKMGHVTVLAGTVTEAREVACKHSAISP